LGKFITALSSALASLLVKVSARKKTVAFRQALLEIEEQEERGYSQIQNQMEKKQVPPIISSHLILF
jgi:hypothetical protein